MSQETAIRPTGITAVALVGALAALAGCASSQAAKQQPALATPSRAEGADHAHGRQTGMMVMSPMRVPGTAVSVSDTEGDVAVVFKTTGEVTEPRRRVRHMAEMMMGMSPDGMVPATAAAEDVEGGARIVLTPRDPSQLGSLRTHVHDHAERLTRGECPMMMGGTSESSSEHQHER